MNKKQRETFIIPYITQIFTLFALGLFQYLIPLAFPWVTKTAIDDVFTNQSEFWSLNKIIMCLIVLYVVSILVSYLNTLESAKLSQNMKFDLSVLMFKKMQTLPKKYFDNEKTGNIQSKIMYDTGEVSNLINSGVISLVMNFIMMIVAIVILLKINVLLTLISVVVFPLYYFLFKRLNHKSRSVWREISKERGNVNSNLMESISGIAVVKSFNQEENEVKAFVNSDGKLRKQQLRAENMTNVVTMVTNSFNNLGSLLIWAIGGQFVLKGHMTIGELVAFQAYITNLYGPIRTLSNIHIRIQSAFSAIERIEEFLNLDSENKGSIPLETLKGKVTVKNLSFQYNKAEEATLKNISFHANPGEVIAFVGESGSGKSTILNLLSRFYEANSGDIYFDNLNIKDIDVHDVRKNIGIVAQDNFLFSGSILENISYGKPQSTYEEVERVAKAVNAHNFIERLENGYDTVIGERGIKLSGGQKQRIAIARTLLTNPSILLLDEATSALDTETESIVVESLDAISNNCTTFIIAHRLSTVQRADRIYVVDKGEIVEEGTHYELLNKGRRYANLYNKQFLQEKKQFA